MKKTFALLAIISAAAAVLTSCSQEFRTGKTEFSENFALTDGRTDSLHISVSVEYPVSGQDADARMKTSTAITAALFGEEYSGMEPEAAAGSYRDDLVEEYRAENLPLAESEEFHESAFRWDDDISGHFGPASDGMVSYIVTHFSYRGGAHGITSEIAYNFDLKTGETVAESDFFSPGYEEPLSRLLTARLPESLETPADTSMMFIREIGPNGNFSVSEDGVTYIYNHYEIAPYAMGIIRVTLPWDDVRELLK